MHTTDQIIQLLATNDRAVPRAILALYNRQTLDEKRQAETKHRNKQGFNACDARYFTYLAGLIQKGHQLYPATLQKARTRLYKYAGQLKDIANAQPTH